MKFFRLTQLFIFLLIGILLGVASSFTMMVLHAYRECENFKNRERAYEERLAHVRQEVERKDKYLQRILHDPDFLERVVREKLGYIRPDEMIFRFKEKTSP